MKFTIKNAGVIKKAEIEFGDLTILCGKNNTGKTYVTYNAFNYIDAIRYFLKVPMDNLYAEQLLEKGKISIPLEPFFNNINKYIETSMEPWVTNEMARQMAAHEDLYYCWWGVSSNRAQYCDICSIGYKYRINNAGKFQFCAFLDGTKFLPKAQI